MGVVFMFDHRPISDRQINRSRIAAHKLWIEAHLTADERSHLLAANRDLPLALLFSSDKLRRALIDGTITCKRLASALGFITYLERKYFGRAHWEPQPSDDI